MTATMPIRDALNLTSRTATGQTVGGWRDRVAAHLTNPIPDADIAELDRLADLAEMEAIRARQAANRSASYLRRRPERYATATYDTLRPDQDPGGKVARWWDHGPRALVLAGPSRTGKTTAAYAIANHVHALNTWVMVWTATALSAALKPGSDEPLAYAYATECPLLVLDDLGRERVTDWWLEQLHRIVDDRCSHGRRLVVTTNAGTTPDGNATPDATYDELVTRYGHPVVERLIDDGGVLVLDGPAVRRVVTDW